MILAINKLIVEEIGFSILETLLMTIASTLIAYLIGLPLGIILNITSKEGIKPNKIIYSVVGIIVNILRSVPFVILAIFISPLTKLIVGSKTGTIAMIVPLTVSAAPYVARMVESSLKEIEHGKIEAAQAMGSSTLNIILKVLLPESKPSLIVGAAISSATILSYTAMAGFIGGGGLGNIAITYGYNRYQSDILLISIILLIIIVQILQELGMFISKKLDKRKHK